MGAGQSRRQSGPGTFMIGQGYADNGDDDDDDRPEDCRPCFLFDVSAARFSGRRQYDDPMGSPFPETPLHERQRNAYRRKYPNGGIDGSNHSLRYAGLEGEDAQSHSNGIRFPTAGMHEGKNAESALQQKYQLMEVLGVGSTSTCYRCVEKATGITHACKVIDKRLIEDRFKGMIGQFRTEIEALRSLHHPNIIRLMDVYSSDEKIFIVMELMEGGELFDYVVQKGTLTEEEASRIVKKVTSALVYMHSKNIVHRDLKPENLLLKKVPRTSNDEVDVKIIDFGLSKNMDEPVTGSFLGTRGYLAPEMLQRREYTRAVDTWALGVIVFVLLCGCLPFDDDSQTVPSDDLVRSKFVLRFPQWARNLSPSAKDLLHHLLDINPATRYTAEQALSHPWVTGKNASKVSMLASPGRIKKSPVLRKRNPQGGRVTNNHHRAQYQTRGTASAAGAPTRVLVRKTSI